MTLEQKIQTFKALVVQSAKQPSFIHHKWYVKYHLEIVEKIALELCERYPQADTQMVNTLVWLHDYGKNIDVENGDKITQITGRKTLNILAFPSDFARKALKYAALIDSDLSTKKDIPIEVKIVSSADGAAHFVGPFFSLWWYENSDKSMEELMEDNIRKAQKNWTKKILLPEIKTAFRPRYEMLLEQCGYIPDRFL